MKNISADNQESAKTSRLHNFLTFFFVFVFCLKMFETFLPYEHGDPLYYHLVGPKIWYQYSWNDMWKDLLLFVHAGAFDFLYIIPFFFFSSLLKIQLFGQFMHFFFSLGIASLFLLKKIPHKVWGPLAGVALLTIARDASFFLYAKNDGVLSLLVLFVSILVLEKDYSKVKLIWIGVLFGVIPSVKMNGFLAVIPLSLYFTWVQWQKRAPLAQTLMVATLAFLILLPTFYKNYYFVGNPFFPALVKQIPGTISKPMFRHYTTFYGNPMNMTEFWGVVADLFLGKVIFLFTPFLMFFNWKKKEKGINNYAILAFVIYGLYLILNGSFRQPRYLFSCYFLLIYFIFLTLANIEQKGWWPKTTNISTEKIKKIFIFLAMVFICCDSKIDKSISHMKMMIKLYSSGDSEREIIHKRIPLTTLWEDFRYQEKDKAQGQMTYVLSDYLSDSYYLPDGVRLHTSEMTPQAAFIDECKDVGDVDKIQFYSYAIIFQKKTNNCYQYIFSHGKLMKEMGGYKVYSLPRIN